MNEQPDINDRYDDIPPEFLCPIRREIMGKPVITESGHSYEESDIKEWLKKTQH